MKIQLTRFPIIFPLVLIAFLSGFTPKIFAGAPTLPLETKSLTLVTTEPLNSFSGKLLTAVYHEISKHSDIKFCIEHYPAKRCNHLSSTGQKDGEAARGTVHSNIHQNLIRVKEPIASLKISAFATDPNLRIHGWHSLQDTNYKLEYRRGLTSFKNNLLCFIKKENLSDIATTVQGLRKLIAHRTDLYVDMEIIVMKLLDTPRFNNTGIRKAGVFETIDIHMFLHKKHRSLAPRLSKVLRHMKQDGSIDRITHY